MLGDDERRVIREHDPTGTDANARCGPRDVRHDHCGCRARDRRNAVVLCQPESLEPKPLDVPRQLRRAPERVSGRAADG
jgi:hypothetical protein